MQGFLKALSEIDNGALVDDCLTELNELVTSIKDTGKKGKFTLELEISPLKNDTEILQIIGVPKIKLPEAQKAHSSIMYAIEGGNLSRKDPRQPDMFTLKTVDDVKEAVDSETGEIRVAG